MIAGSRNSQNHHHGNSKPSCATSYPHAAESGMSAWSWPDQGLSSPSGCSGYFACFGEVRAFNGSQNHPRVRDLESMVDVNMFVQNPTLPLGAHPSISYPTS